MDVGRDHRDMPRLVAVVFLLGAVLQGIDAGRCRAPTKPFKSTEFPSPVQRQYAEGSAFFYSCRTPGRQQKQKISVCQGDGKWLDPVECPETVCNQPPDIPHTNKTRGPFIPGKKVVYNCLPDFHPNSTKIKCLKKNLLWSNPNVHLTCYPKTSCEDPRQEGHVVSSYYSKHDDTIIAGDWRVYRCAYSYTFEENYDYDDYNYYDDDYEVKTEYNMTCTENGWDKILPKCEEQACELPESKDNLVMPVNNRTKFYEGDVIRFRCLHGYRLKGSHIATCKSSTWDGMPACQRITCPEIDDPEHGMAIGSNTYLGTVTISCWDGFSLVGSETRTCGAYGRWSGDLSICDSGDSFCPNPGIPVSGQREGSSFSSGSRVSFKCNPGYILYGNASRTCLPSRQWSGDPVVCMGQYEFDDPRVTARILNRKLDSFGIQSHTSSVSRKQERHYMNRPNVLLNGLSMDGAGRTSFGELARDPGGLDMYLVFDTSASIEDEDLATVVNLLEIIIKKVGVSEKGDMSGTKIGIVAFNNTVHFQYHPSEVKNENDVMETLRKIKEEMKPAGGTDITAALRAVAGMMSAAVHSWPHRTKNSVKAVVLVSDGEFQSGGNPTEMARDLEESYGAEIFCISVSDVRSMTMSAVATDPLQEHLFVFKEYIDVGDLADIMWKKEVDYSDCGRGGAKDLVNNQKAVGGDTVKDGVWSWMAGIYYIGKGNPPSELADKEDRAKHICGGSLLEVEGKSQSKWILTAAHCIKIHDPNRFIVRLGTRLNPTADSYGNEEQEKNKGIVVGVKNITIHSNFTRSNLYSDIALLELAEEVIYTPLIRPICLPNAGDREMIGEKGYVTGWGMTRNNSISRRLLRQVKVEIQDKKTCRDSIVDENHKGKNHEKAFCAGGIPSEDGNYTWQDACTFDSGGPLVVNLNSVNGQNQWTQRGIVSWGEGCGRINRYGWYTRVWNFVDWIKNIIESNP